MNVVIHTKYKQYLLDNLENGANPIVQTIAHGLLYLGNILDKLTWESMRQGSTGEGWGLPHEFPDWPPPLEE